MSDIDWQETMRREWRATVRVLKICIFVVVLMCLGAFTAGVIYG